MRLFTSRLSVLCNTESDREQRVVKALLDRGRKIGSIGDITDHLILIDAVLILITIIKNEIKQQSKQMGTLLKIINKARDIITETFSQTQLQAEMQTQKSPANLASYLSVSAHCLSVANDLNELPIHLVGEVRDFLYKLSVNLAADNKDGKNLQLHAQVMQIACCIPLINSAHQTSEHSFCRAENADDTALTPPALPTSPTSASPPIVVSPQESVTQLTDQTVMPVRLSSEIREEVLTRINGLLHIIEFITGDLIVCVTPSPEKPTIGMSASSVQVNAPSRTPLITENKTVKTRESDAHLSAPSSAALTIERSTIKRSESDNQLNTRLRADSAIARQAAIPSETAVDVNAKSSATLTLERLKKSTGFEIIDLQLSTDLHCVANELLKCNILSGVELLLRLSFIFLPPPKQKLDYKHECLIYLSMVNYLCAEIKLSSGSKQINNGIIVAELLDELYRRLRQVIGCIEDIAVRLPPDSHLSDVCIETAKTLESTSPKLKAEKCKFNMFAFYFLEDERMATRDKGRFYIIALPDVLSDITSRTARLFSLPLKVNKIIQVLRLQISLMQSPREFFEQCKSSLSDLIKAGFYELVESICLFGLQVTPAEDVDALLLLQVIRFKSLQQQKPLSKRIAAEKVLIEIAKLFNHRHYIHLLHLLNTEDKNHTKKHALSELNDRTEDEEDIRLIMYLAMFKRLYGPEFNEKYLVYYTQLCNFMIDIMVGNADHAKLFSDYYFMLNKVSNETESESKQGFLHCCYALCSMLKMVYIDGNASVRSLVEIQTFFSIEENNAEFLWWRNRLEEKINAMVSGSNLVAENRYLRCRVDDLEKQVADLKRVTGFNQDTDFNYDTALKRVLKNGQSHNPQLPVLFNGLRAHHKNRFASKDRGRSVERVVRDELLGNNNAQDDKQSALTPGGRTRSSSQP